MVWSFSQSKVEPVSTHLKALFFSPKVGVCDDTWILLLAVPGNVHGVCRSMCARCSDHLTSGWSSRGAQRYKKKLQGFHGFLEDQCLLSKITQIPVETPTFSFFSMFFACFFMVHPQLWNLQGVSAAAAGRHGTTTWNLAKKWQGQQDTELAPEGIQQAEETGKLLASRSRDGKVAMDLWWVESL